MGTDVQQQFCLRWHNFQNSLLTTLPQLLDGDDLTDVTLCAGGKSIKAHKIVLSACSQYFKEIFRELQPMQHPVIVIPGTDFSDLCALVTFMYSGEVNIYQHQLPSILKIAVTLQIRGLSEFTADGVKKESGGKRRWGEGRVEEAGPAGPWEDEAEDLSSRRHGPTSPPPHQPPPATITGPDTHLERSWSMVGAGEGGGSGPGRGQSKLCATCFICGKQLSNPYNLRVHLETHQNTHQACPVCSHVSRSRDALRKHVSYRHPQLPPEQHLRRDQPPP